MGKCLNAVHLPTHKKNSKKGKKMGFFFIMISILCQTLNLFGVKLIVFNDLLDNVAGILGS